MPGGFWRGLAAEEGLGRTFWERALHGTSGQDISGAWQGMPGLEQIWGNLPQVDIANLTPFTQQYLQASMPAATEAENKLISSMASLGQAVPGQGISSASQGGLERYWSGVTGQAMQQAIPAWLGYEQQRLQPALAQANALSSPIQTYLSGYSGTAPSLQQSYMGSQQGGLGAFAGQLFGLGLGALTGGAGGALGQGLIGMIPGF